MINRKYFISAQCHRNDGSMSYSHYSTIGAFRSLSKSQIVVFKAMSDDAKSYFEAKGMNADNMQLIAFNRV